MPKFSLVQVLGSVGRAFELYKWLTSLTNRS
jgi:hypothetical protein